MVHYKEFQPIVSHKINCRTQGKGMKIYFESLPLFWKINQSMLISYRKRKLSSTTLKTHQTFARKLTMEEYITNICLSLNTVSGSGPKITI